MQALDEPAVCVVPAQTEYQGMVWMSEPVSQVTNEAPSTAHGPEPGRRTGMILD